MISKLAHVSTEASIGKDVTIEPFAYVAADVVIGDGCWIGPGAVIMDGARLGKGCKIHTSAVIAGIPQDLKFRGEHSTAEIGDNTTVREGATINRGTAARGRTVIGSDVLIMACAHVGHDCIIGDHCIIVNNVLLGGEVEMGDWAIISGQSAVHQFTRIGEHAMISGGSLVSKDVPAYVKTGHNPLSYVGVNFIGLRRRNFSSEEVAAIQDIYRIIFQSGYAYSKACEIVEEQIPQSSFRDSILEFIRSSKRGIIKPYNPNRKDEDLD